MYNKFPEPTPDTQSNAARLGVAFGAGIVAAAAFTANSMRSKNQKIDHLTSENVELASRIEQLQEENLEQELLANTDPMTGLANRRKMQTIFDQYVDKNVTFGVISIDLENFKRVNDTLGHIEGDNMLKEFSKQIFNKGTRDSDVSFHLVGPPDEEEDTKTSYRMGGDEFAILVVMPEEEPETTSGKRSAEHKFTPEESLQLAGIRLKSLFESTEKVLDYNRDLKKRNKLGMRFNTSVYQPGMSLDDLLMAAESKGYGKNKRLIPKKLISAIYLTATKKRATV
jgi:GGDEF domain-containing protein